MKWGERSLELFNIFGRLVVDNEKAVDALEETSQEAERTSESIGEVGSETKKTGDTTKKTAPDIVSAFKTMSISAGALVTAVVSIVKKMVELADSTRDYRTEMGKLNTAFTTAGHTTDTATKAYRQLNAVLGETDQAVEAANHLAMLCDSEEQLELMTEACIGIYAKFGSSLPIEGLTEAANETAKTGMVVGQLADALNWAGASEDEFNAQLAACNSERERAALITNTLVDLYGDSAKAYKDNNKEILASVTAQDKLNAATARWGEIFEPIAAAWYEFLAFIANEGADAFEAMLDPTHGVADEMVGVCTTMEEAEGKMKEFQDEIDALNAKPIKDWTDFDHERYFLLTSALAEAKRQYDDLAEAAGEAGDAAADAADPEVVSQFDQATTQYVTDMTTLLDSFVQTYEGVFNMVSGWFDPFEEASVKVTTSIGEMMAAMQSQIDFNNTYTANLEALKEYGLGGLAQSFEESGAAGAAYAATIVQAVEAAGGATTEEGQAIIQGFTDLNQQLTDSQGELAQTMTLLDGEFETEMQSIVDTYGEAIDGLDKSAEAADAAASTFQAFYEAMNKEIPGIVSAVGSFGTQITTAIQNGIGTITIPFELVGDGGYPHKDGLDYVPYDEYPALLHKGEAVLTAEEAAAWRAGKETASAPDSSGGAGSTVSGGITIIQNINAVEQTPVELASATAAYFEQARWAV